MGEHASHSPHNHDPITWLGRHEFATLLAIALIAAGIWAFAELADEVTEGTTASFDKRILLAMRNPANPADPLGPDWIEEVGRDLTALGGMIVLTFLTLAVAGYLLLDGKRHAALFVILAIAGGMLLSLMLKKSFDRPRPDLVPYASKIMTTSFPSGHSMMSAVTYLTLGALLAACSRGRQ